MNKHRVGFVEASRRKSLQTFKRRVIGVGFIMAVEAVCLSALFFGCK